MSLTIDFTSEFALPKFNPGDKGWDVPLGARFDALDAMLGGHVIRPGSLGSDGLPAGLGFSVSGGLFYRGGDFVGSQLLNIDPAPGTTGTASASGMTYVWYAPVGDAYEYATSTSGYPSDIVPHLKLGRITCDATRITKIQLDRNIPFLTGSTESPVYYKPAGINVGVDVPDVRGGDVGLYLRDCSISTAPLVLPAIDGLSVVNGINGNGTVILIVKKVDATASAAVIVAAGGQSIDGAGTFSLTRQNECVTLRAVNLQAPYYWAVISHYVPG